MKKRNGYYKRIIAITVAILLLMSSLIIGVVTASAESLAEGLTNIATSSTDGGNHNGFNGFRTITDLSAGGIKYETDGNGARSPYVHNEPVTDFPGTGVTMRFDGYSSTTTTEDYGYRSILIVLSTKPGTTNAERTYYRLGNGVAGIIIDTHNGDINLVRGNDSVYISGHNVIQTVVDNSNTLKYDNITNKPFTVDFYKTEDDSIGVKIVVNGDEANAAIGVIDMEKYNSIPIRPTSDAYFSISSVQAAQSGTSQQMTLNYYGFKVEIAPPSPLLNGLTDIATTAKDYETRKDLRTVRDLNGGGVSISYGKLSGYGPYRFTSNLGAFPGDGLMMQFANYKINTTDTTLTGYGQIAIALSNTLEADEEPRTKIKDFVPFLQIDTVNGTVMLRYCNDTSFGVKEGFTDVQTVIAANDTLKSDNIQDKPFSVTVKMADDNINYSVIVDVDGTKVSGTITKELMNAIKYHPTDTDTYMSVGGIDNNSGNENSWSIEFYGIKDLGINTDDNTVVKAADAAEVVADINALSDQATLEASAEILLAKAKYDSLSDTVKKSVTNADKLNSLMTALNTLRQNNKYKPTSTYIAEDPEFDEQYPNPNTRTVFSSVTDNGFKAEWRGAAASTGAITVLRTQSITGVFPLEDLRVHIDNFTFEQANESDFWIQFTSGDYSDIWDGTSGAANRMIAIHLGLSENEVEINGCGSTQSWYPGFSDALVRDNLKGKSIIVEWFKNDAGEYVCSLTVGEAVTAFSVPAYKLDAMPDFNPEKVRVIIGTQNIKNVFSMEVTGINGKIDDNVKNVMNQIDALPSNVASDTDVNTVNAVIAAYNALTTVQKEQVLNVKTLTNARALVRKYEGKDAEGRDKDGYYIPTAASDIFGDTRKNPVYNWVEESEYGGLRWQFNNSSYGHKNCFANYYVIDGISVRFDNFNYGNDSAFIVGFEDDSMECKSYDLTADLSAVGIYLVIGKGNTIYSTYPNRDYTRLFALFEPNEKLSSTNLMNKEFFVSWEENDDKTLTMTFTVDGTDFVYHYDENYMAGMERFDTEKIQVVIHANCGFDPSASTVQKANKQQSASVDITGIKYNKFSGTQMKQIQEVIDAINTLPNTASYEIEEDVNEIFKQYYQLVHKEMRLGVTNFSKLLKLSDALFDMHLADGTMYGEVENSQPNNNNNTQNDIEPEQDNTQDEYDNTYDEYVDNSNTKDDEALPEENPDTQDGEESVKKPVKVDVDNTDSETDVPGWIISTIIIGLILLTIILVAFIIFVRRKQGGE